MSEIFNTIPPTARFLKGRVRVGATRTPDRRKGPTEERLLICTDPGLPATEIITGYAKRFCQASREMRANHNRSSLQTLPACYILWAGARPDRTEKTACNLPADTPERVKISAS